MVKRSDFFHFCFEMILVFGTIREGYEFLIPYLNYHVFVSLEIKTDKSALANLSVDFTR